MSEEPPEALRRAFRTREADAPLESWDDPVRGRVDWRTLVSGDRTPSDGLTAGIAEVGEGDGGEPRLHRHAQAEIYHILAGRGVMRLEGERLELQAGDTVFIPGGAWHGARGVGREPLRLLYVLAADSFEEVIYEFPGPA